MAVEWLDADRGALERLAWLVDERGRRPVKVGELSAALAIEDRFGLSARSRRGLGWTVLAQEAELAEEPRLSSSANVRRLRAIDPEPSESSPSADLP